MSLEAAGHHPGLRIEAECFAPPVVHAGLGQARYILLGDASVALLGGRAAGDVAADVIVALEGLEAGDRRASCRGGSEIRVGGHHLYGRLSLSHTYLYPLCLTFCEDCLLVAPMGRHPVDPADAPIGGPVGRDPAEPHIPVGSAEGVVIAQDCAGVGPAIKVSVG